MSGDSRNYGVGKWRRDRAREKPKKRRLTLGFHNGKLQVLAPLWWFMKMNVKQMIKIGMLGIRG